jgi:hypothetical protein
MSKSSMKLRFHSVLSVFHLCERVCVQSSPLDRFVTTMREHSARPGVETRYLIRSYNHEERTTPKQWMMMTRRPPRQPTRSNTDASTRQGQISNIERPGDIISNRADQINAKAQPKINYGKAQSFPIWQVARAATAAPAYFEPLKIETPESTEYSIFKDAGLGPTINPTQEGIREILDLYGENSIGVVVSVGTAKQEKLWGGGIKRPMNALASKAADPELIHTSTSNDSKREGFPYYRLNDPGTLNIELDEWEPKQRHLGGKIPGSKTLKRMKEAFYNWASKLETAEQFENCANELVRRRQARSKDCFKWERYAIGAQFRCRHKGCERGSFDNRGEFHHHLLKDHSMSQDDLDKETNSCMSCWKYRSAPSGRMHESSRNPKHRERT